MTNKMTEKKAKTFDIDALFAESKAIAAERSRATLEAMGVTSPEKAASDKNDREKDEEDDSDDEYGPILPPQSGNKDEVEGEEEEEEKDESVVKKQVGDEEEEDEGVELSNDFWIPTEREVCLEHGSKVVSAIAIDNSGQRLASGGYDYSVKFFDFAGMDASFKPFRSFEPVEAHQIRHLAYNSSSELLLIISGKWQAKVVTREGGRRYECPKGYPFIRDMANTKGHVAMLTGGCWHPKDKDSFVTSSLDGTLRLWTVFDEEKHQTCIKPRSADGRRALPTSVTYDQDGSLIAAGCQDGSLQIWDQRRTNVTTSMINRNAHRQNTDVSCVEFSYDNTCLASRSCDGTLKLWDLRNFSKSPLFAVADLPNDFAETSCSFSPNDRMVFTGLSTASRDGPGYLSFFNRVNGELISRLEVSNSSVIRSLWHPKLNQIVATCADGKIKMLFDEKKSLRGACLCVVRPVRKPKQQDVVFAERIITPFALPMFKEDRQRSTRVQLEKMRQDPKKTKRPDLPMAGPGTGGRIAKQGATLHQYVIQTVEIRKPTYWDENPREAILRHAKEAEENPHWIAPAYKETQPKPVFNNEPQEDKKEQPSSSKKPKLG